MLARSVSLPGHPCCIWEPHHLECILTVWCGSGAAAEIQCPAKKAEQGAPDSVSWSPLNGLDNHETPPSRIPPFL